MGGKSETKTENKPPDWTLPGYQMVGQDVQDLYKSGAGGHTYRGSTVSPLSGTTMQGVNQLAQAGTGWDTAGTRPLYQQLGAGAVSNPYMSQLSDMAGGDVLEGYASGANLQGEGNPFYRQRLEGELDDTAAQVRSLMSGMGRGGGDFEVDALGNALAEQRIGALENDWNREQGRQFDALGLQSGLLSNAGGLYATGIGQAQGAADAMSGLDQRNFENRLTGAGATLQAGGILDDQSRALLADEVNKFYQLDNEDWQRIAMMNAALGGASGNYGQQLSTSRQSPGIGDFAGLFSPTGK